MNKSIILSLVAAGLLACPAVAQEPVKTRKVYAVSDAHLDTQWNWDIQTTIRDHVWKTLDRNLFLLGQYPDYIFNFEGAVKYNWMKEYYPRDYELMKHYIADGRWHISGASWDANDVVVPSVESQIRNIMLGQNYCANRWRCDSV
ncbi:MAG: hypothetical protein NC336_04160 [Clostridium sp.]|nr:hypothetical protein [Clostridium sp.]